MLSISSKLVNISEFLPGNLVLKLNWKSKDNFNVFNLIDNLHAQRYDTCLCNAVEIVRTAVALNQNVFILILRSAAWLVMKLNRKLKKAENWRFQK